MAVTYTTDFYGWLNEQAGYLNKGLFELLDRKHLSEELEIMGSSELSELESRLYNPSTRGQHYGI